MTKSRIKKRIERLKEQLQHFEDYKQVFVQDWVIKPEYCVICKKEVNGMTCYWDGVYREFLRCEKCMIKSLEREQKIDNSINYYTSLLSR